MNRQTIATGVLPGLAIAIALGGFAAIQGRLPDQAIPTGRQAVPQTGSALDRR